MEGIKKDQKMFANPAFRKQAFIIIAVCFVLFYIQSSIVNDSLSVYKGILQETRGWTALQITAPQTYGKLIGIPLYVFLGYWIMKKGVKSLLVPTLFLAGIADLLLVNINNLALYTVCMSICTLCIKSIALCAATLCANWFIMARGRVLGFVTIGCCVSTATCATLFTKAVNAFGYEVSFSAYAIFLIVFGVICLLVVKDAPEDVGLTPDGIERSAEEMAAMKPDPNYDPSKTWPVSRIFKTKETWLLIVSFGILNLSLVALMSFFVTAMRAAGFPINQVLTAITVGGFCAIPVSYIFGWIDDKFGTKQASVILVIADMAFVAAMLLASSGSVVCLALAAFGLACMAGGLPNLDTSIVMTTFGRRDFAHVRSWLVAVQGIISAFAGPYMAVFADKAVAAGLNEVDGYNNAYKVLLVLLVVALVCLLFLRKSYDTEKQALLKNK